MSRTSTAKLVALTAERQALLPQIRDRWINIGLSTERGDHAAAEAAVADAYCEANLMPPACFLWLPSPLHGVVANLFILGLTDRASVYASVGDSVRASVYASVRASVYSLVLYGQYDASWLGFYEAFSRFGLSVAERLRPQMRIAEHVGWYWPYEKLCILTEKPTALHRDEAGRLHCESGPALEYRDDAGDHAWGIWAWHGTRVGRDVVEELSTLDRVLAEPNAEIRRILLDRLDKLQLVDDPRVTCLHHDIDGAGQPRRLLSIDLPNDPDLRWVGVHVKCPSTGHEVILRVPPATRRCDDAVAWTYNVPTPDYRPLVEA